MASVITEWSCGCNDRYNFDRHEGLSWICNQGDECVQKKAQAYKDNILLFPSPPAEPTDG